jgi:hypothetical protein
MRVSVVWPRRFGSNRISVIASVPTAAHVPETGFTSVANMEVASPPNAVGEPGFAVSNRSTSTRGTL